MTCAQAAFFGALAGSATFIAAAWLVTVIDQWRNRRRWEQKQRMFGEKP